MNFKFLFLLFPIAGMAQVGINNPNPTSCLDIVTKGNTSATKSVRVSNSSTTETLTLTDDGDLGVSVPAPQKRLDVNANNDAIRLRTLAASAATATNTDGTVRSLVYNTTTGDVNHRLTKQVQSVTIANGASATITDLTGGVNGTLLVRTAINSGAPGSNIMATLNYARRGLGLLGIAYDNGPNAPSSTRTSTSGDNVAVNYNISAGVFVFSITKPTANTIRITNNSGDVRTFTITTESIF